MNNKKIPLFSHPFLLIILIYRYSLSPLIGGQCRFYPTCSHYAEEAFKEYGAFKGMIMSIKRIFRCHPWHKGGYDPVSMRNLDQESSG